LREARFDDRWLASRDADDFFLYGIDANYLIALLSQTANAHTADIAKTENANAFLFPFSSAHTPPFIMHFPILYCYGYIALVSTETMTIGHQYYIRIIFYKLLYFRDACHDNGDKHFL
jgi:hypothetical protein